MTSVRASTAQSDIYNPPGTTNNKENLVDSKPACSVINIEGTETTSSAEEKNKDRRERVLNKMSVLQVDERIVKLVNDTGVSVCGDRQSTSSAEGRGICRICHGCGEEALISPCHCAGSAQFVHGSCLTTWFKKSSRTTCELCSQYIKIVKRLKRLSQWQLPSKKPIPVLWCIAFHFSFILNLLAIVFHATESCFSSLCVMFYVLNSLGIVANAFYLACWYPPSVIYFRNWMASNEEWTLVEEENPALIEDDNNETSEDVDEEEKTTPL